MNAIYRKYFSSAPPARATVIAGLAGSQYAVEITLVASSAPKRVIADGRPVNPNLSAAIRAGDRVYAVRHARQYAETKGDVGAQTRETLARIRAALDRRGLFASRRRRQRRLSDGDEELRRDERRLPPVLRARFPARAPRCRRASWRRTGWSRSWSPQDVPRSDRCHRAARTGRPTVQRDTHRYLFLSSRPGGALRWRAQARSVSDRHAGPTGRMGRGLPGGRDGPRHAARDAAARSFK